MRRTDGIDEWWARALLGEALSAHPVFGRDVHVHVDGPVITLTGHVETVGDAEELEGQARALPSVEAVVNHLSVTDGEGLYHWQTVIAVFADEEQAKVACQAVSAVKMHNERSANILTSRSEAEPLLQERAETAGVPRERIQRYLSDLDRGKALCVDRIPEDDALRVISALEGTRAESIQTLPPEPARCEES